MTGQESHGREEEEEEWGAHTINNEGLTEVRKVLGSITNWKVVGKHPEEVIAKR